MSQMATMLAPASAVMYRSWPPCPPTPMHATLIWPYLGRVVATWASGGRAGLWGLGCAGGFSADAASVAGFVCASTICAPAAIAAAAAAEPFRNPRLVNSLSDMWIDPLVVST